MSGVLEPAYFESDQEWRPGDFGDEDGDASEQGVDSLLTRFRGPKCQLPLEYVRSVMSAVAGKDIRVQKSAAIAAGHLARLFAGELVEAARKLSSNNEPITPELIVAAIALVEKENPSMSCISAQLRI